MLYSEFIEGTRCVDNEHNYKVYKDLEVMYMNTELTKEDIYRYGVKLVDNSKPQRQIEFENSINGLIETINNLIDISKRAIENEESLPIQSEEYIKHCKDNIKYYKSKIKDLKWVLSADR